MTIFAFSFQNIRKSIITIPTTTLSYIDIVMSSQRICLIWHSACKSHRMCIQNEIYFLFFLEYKQSVEKLWCYVCFQFEIWRPYLCLSGGGRNRQFFSLPNCQEIAKSLSTKIVVHRKYEYRKMQTVERTFFFIVFIGLNAWL